MNLIENQVHTQVGCRLTQFADRWSEITQDQWILDVVQEGLQLNFQIPPHMSGTRVTCTQNNVQSQCLLEEVESLFLKDKRVSDFIQHFSLFKRRAEDFVQY